jgi:hypothetical protein
MSEQIINADHYATSYNGSGAGLVTIPRTALLAAAPNTVVVNDGGGALAGQAQLATSLGGTGVDSSAFTGVAKVAAGTWSASTIANADIDAAAAIARSKLANGTANYVVINGVGGGLSEEAALATSRGGTGTDLSGVAGPAALTVTGGAVSTLAYAQPATPLTLAQRDVAGGLAVATLAATAVQTPTISSVGDLTISPAGGDIFLQTSILHLTPVGIAGGDTYRVTGNVETVGAVTAAVVSVTTATNRVYGLKVNVAVGSTLGHGGQYTCNVRAKNIGGVVTLGAVLLKSQSRDAAIDTSDITVTAAGASVFVNGVGVVGATLRWAATVDVVEQTI